MRRGRWTKQRGACAAALGVAGMVAGCRAILGIVPLGGDGAGGGGGATTSTGGGGSGGGSATQRFHLGAAGTVTPRGVLAGPDPGARAVIVGDVAGASTSACSFLQGSTTEDAFIAGYDLAANASSDCGSGRRVGSNGSVLRGMAVGRDGLDFIVAGRYAGEANFGCLQSPSSPPGGLFVTKLGSETGCGWSLTKSTTTFDAGQVRDVDLAIGEGFAYVASLYVDEAGIEFGGPCAIGPGVGPNLRAFVAAFDLVSGDCKWLTASELADYVEFAPRVAHAPSGGVFVSGVYASKFQLPGCPLIEAASKKGAYVARLDPSDGNCALLKNLADLTESPTGFFQMEKPIHLAARSDGGVVVAAAFANKLMLGGSERDASKSDVLLTALSPSLDVEWARQPLLGSPDRLAGLVLDLQENIIFVGDSSFGLSLANGSEVASRGASDVFVVKLDSQGLPIWESAVVLGGPDDEFAGGAAIDSENNILVTGSYKQAFTLGGESLPDAGDSQDAFLAKLVP